MSDLRLEDLVVLNPNIEGDYYPVTRVEVLVALGAAREWRCRWDHKCSPGGMPHRPLYGQSCGWRWVVPDE